MTNETTKQAIASTIADNRIVLFMKGTKLFPQCGFSGQVVQILQRLGADFTDINVLSDDNLRSGIKEFSQWPTVPQLYVDGEFIGGCDIVTEMFEDGELDQLLSSNNKST